MLPHILTIAVGSPIALRYLAWSTLGGFHLCDSRVYPGSYGLPMPWWHAVWPVAEFAALGGLAAPCVSFWGAGSAAAPVTEPLNAPRLR